MTLNASISAVVINWNGKQWLKRCLESLQSQSWPFEEIILVDNGSSDGSADFVEKEFPGVKLIRIGTNLGFAAGNNLGVKEAAGEYILLVNNDTWLENNCAENLLTALSRDALDVAGPVFAGYNDEIRVATTYTIDPFGHPVALKGDIFAKRFFLIGAGLLMKTELFLETGGFDEEFFMYVEDVDFFWRLNLTGKKIGVEPGACIHHLGGAGLGGGLSYERFLWRNTNTLRCLIKNYPLYILMPVLPLLAVKHFVQSLCFIVIMRPRIAWTFPAAWLRNSFSLRRTWNARRKIRAGRTVADSQVFKKMYFGLGELRQLKDLASRGEKIE